MNYLVTGCAGFIGFHLAKRLLEQGERVVGLDNLCDYYDVNLKYSRLEILSNYPKFNFLQIDLVEKYNLKDLFKKEKFDYVLHMAAQAGVRYSLDSPQSYIDSNLIGHFNILECCREYPVKHLIYASSSSVYGANSEIPYSTKDKTDSPMSLYAATKKSNELMTYSYSSLFAIPATGLRFFTVYGPWGRPDMALFKFTQKILSGETIDVYNYGEMERDFTYIDDIVEAVIRTTPLPPESKKESGNLSGCSSFVPFRVLNIGNGNPIKLMDFIRILEKELGVEAKKNLLPIQAGDVYRTYSDTDELYKLINYSPVVNVDEGVKYFVDWYKEYYRVDK